MLVFPQGSSVPLLAETRDIGINGFFCALEEPFGIGQKLRCLILLNEPSVTCQDKCGMCLEVEVEVVRVVADRSQSSFGIGCNTLDFRVVPHRVWMSSFPLRRPAVCASTQQPVI
jgi:hypothetical protein